MKEKIRKSLAKILNPFASKLGFITNTEIADVNHKNNLLSNFYSILHQIGFQPKHIVDIGANHGTWTKEALNHFPDAYYTLLEPQYWLKDSISDLLKSNPKITFHEVGAGAKEGSFKFTIVGRDDSCSFRYTEEEAKAQGYKQIEIPVVTLNGLLNNSELPVPDLIKIDAEGLDIEVLQGSDSFFGKTEIFMVEAGVVNKAFDNSFLKLLTFMDNNGYRLFEITDLNRPFQPPVLWLVELVFIKKNGFIDSYKFI